MRHRKAAPCFSLGLSKDVRWVRVMLLFLLMCSARFFVHGIAPFANTGELKPSGHGAAAPGSGSRPVRRLAFPLAIVDRPIGD